MSDQDYLYTIYRNCSLGRALADTLDDSVTSSRIEPQLANKIMLHFDEHMTQVLRERVRARCTVKGPIDNYRNVDEVYVFNLKNADVKLDDAEHLSADKLRIVATKAKQSS